MFEQIRPAGLRSPTDRRLLEARWEDAWSKFPRSLATQWPTPPAAAPGGHRNGFWGFLSLPGVAWLVGVLFVVPFSTAYPCSPSCVSTRSFVPRSGVEPLSWGFSAMRNKGSICALPWRPPLRLRPHLAYVGLCVGAVLPDRVPKRVAVLRRPPRQKSAEDCLLAAPVYALWITTRCDTLAWV